MTPQPTPAERFAIGLLCLSQAVAVRTVFGLSLPLIARIIGRLRGIKQRFERVATLVREGRYAPRRSGPRSPGIRRPRQPGTLPRSRGWLLKLMPEAVGYRAQLDHLFRDPETAALLAAAPASLGRPIRSLCRMLDLDVPEILALPARPRPPPARRPPPPPKAPPPPPKAPPPAPPLRQPAWMPHRTRWTMARIRGAPRTA